MKKLALGAMIALGLSVTAISSQAGTYFVQFDRTSQGGLAATGDILAELYLITSDVLNAAGAYDVLGISSGHVDGDAVVGLSPDPNPNHPFADISVDGAFIFDQNLFPANPYFSNPGLLFQTVGKEYNLFSSGSSYELLAFTGGPGYARHSIGTVSVTAVPEPAAWAMMIGGFGLAGGLLRRRKAIAA